MRQHGRQLNRSRGWIVLGVLLLAPPVWAGVPVVSDVLVTDVTDRSFSVVWTASEASTGSLNVFDGPLCTTVTAGITLVSHPVLNPDPAVKDAIKTAAEDKGILKVQVSGLAAAAPYCVQTVTTSKSTLEQPVAPAVPQNVTTQIQVTRTRTIAPSPDLLPFANDVIAHPLYAPDQTTAVTGGIVAMGVLNLLGQSLSNIVASVVGDGGAAPMTLTDLNNLFDPVNLQTVNLLGSGSERLRLLEYRGLAGCKLERFRKVPTDLGLAEIKAPAACFNSADFDCTDRVNILDVLRVAGGFGSRAGDFCYNPDLDVIVSSNVNILDVLAVAGRFGLTP